MCYPELLDWRLFSTQAEKDILLLLLREFGVFQFQIFREFIGCVVGRRKQAFCM